MITNPAIRKWLYLVGPAVIVILQALTTAGIITGETATSITNAVTSVLVLAVGGTAVSNLSPKPAVIRADGVAVITDALDAYAKQAQPAIESVQAQVQQQVQQQVQAAQQAVTAAVDPFIRR